MEQHGNFEERRRHPRQKTFLHGKVYFNNRNATADCVIRDISEAGARLKFTVPVTLPEIFELHIPHRHDMFRAQIVWNRGNEMGVMLNHADAGPVDSPSIVSSGAPMSMEERVAKLEHDLVALRRKLDAIAQVTPGMERE
jgi:hypothetical protein